MLDRLGTRLGQAIHLYERITRVINTQGLRTNLRRSGKTLIDFALDWPDYRKFEDLPAMYQEAILAGEKELELKRPAQ